MSCNMKEGVAAGDTAAQAEAGCGREPGLCRQLHCDSKARGELSRIICAGSCWERIMRA